MRFPVVALAMAAALAVPAAAQEECRLQLAASMPMDGTKPQRVVVPVALDGKPMTVMVDTGSPFTGMTGEAAARLGLAVHEIIAPVHIVFPLGGGRATHYVKSKDFKMGALTADHVQFLIMPAETDEADGLLGADFIRQFDVEFDFAGGKFNLFSPHRCAGKAVYWNTTGAPVAIVPFDADREDPHIRIDLTVDGKTVPAILDTGAPTTSIPMSMAKDIFGIDENSPGVERTGKTRWRYHFKNLSLEGVNVDNPDIMIRADTKSEKTNRHAILGINILRHLHVYVAYRERKLYVTGASVH